MNFLDALLLLAAIGAAFYGFTRGAAIQVLSFAGAAAGLALGASIARRLSPLFSGAFGKILVNLLLTFGLAAVLAVVGRQYGARAWKALEARGLGRVDAAVGGGVAVVGMLLVAWLVSGMLNDAGVVVPKVVARSAVIRGIDAELGQPPEVFTRIAALLYPGGLPTFFAEFGPPAPSVPKPAGPGVRAAVSAAGRSTVKIEGEGCGGIKSGSGFVGAAGLVVTNAHVVAGVPEPFVVDANGRHGTTTVLFDPQLDLAVLRASGLAGQPLHVSRTLARRGTGGAVLGYPGGAGFDAAPAAVRSEFEALGSDIYHRATITRSIYQLDANVHPGNSGGPFVTSSGEVLGVVFAASAIRDNLAYALTGPDIAIRIDRAEALHEAVGDGPCNP